MTYIWTKSKGGHLISPRAIMIPIAEKPLTGVHFDKLEFDGETGKKIVSGVEVPLSATERFNMKRFLKPYIK